ncbi:hypothetical protein [Actinomadura sp. HBU206391]|uniref:hypothetical protein n=1 Tax=Actinomadura sp. HBU206391 TaxID=2731692 RepID=UPI00164FC57A|nr:hypothetical protein [Actinomadura sp. HBU206391]MBC6461120.1 hypothetical protein [Actinomadura sp. HBU206391]
MTVILILACLAIAGAELYMARGARQVAARLEKLEAIARLHDQRIRSMTAGGGGTAPPSDRRLATGTAQPGTPGTAQPDADPPHAAQPGSATPGTTAADADPPHTAQPGTASPGTTPVGSASLGAAETAAAETAAELARLTAETTRLRERLGGLEEARTSERRLYARVNGAVESLEQVVGELLRHNVGRLDEAVTRTLGAAPVELDADSATVRGVLCRAAPGSQDPLIRAYERCARDTGLWVRFRLPSAAEPWHARYYLAGKDPRELERDFLALLAGARSPAATGGETAFQGLLRTLGELPAGFAQIGPMVAARVPDALLCGVLTLAETRGFDAEALVGDPAAVAGRLRVLPAERLRDLTMWAPPNGSDPDPDLSAAPQP